ncbi:MAG: type II toxin-antitoxin system RelE/ParE family toxin [Lacunisphaera sp.]|nr:type II toxin-antitoxin system RelE/ParE family toxin [Lacunisphaera sp.]
MDPAARDEYREAAEHYLKESPRIASVFVDQVEATIALIRKNPTTWRILEHNVRRCLVKRFPFGIYYTVEKDEIVVWAIMHLRREPGYWHERRAH